MAPCLATSRVAEASTSYPSSTGGRVRLRSPQHKMHTARMVRSCSFANTAHMAHLQHSVPVCSLRKEKKKLAKTIKSHRKRLEKVLRSAGTLGCETSLAEVHAELKRLNELLSSQEAASAASRLHDADGGSSSSSSSDSERESPRHQIATRAAQQQQQQPLQPGFARGSINALLTLADLEVPNLDDITPVSYSTPGRVLVCQGSKCQAQGATDLLRRVSHMTSATEGIDVIPCKCMGKCGQAPALRLKAEGQTSVLVGSVQPAELPAILQQQFGA